MIQVVSPIGDRPIAWALSQRYMAAQSYCGPVRWIVVDDGTEPSSICFNRNGYSVEIHRLPPDVGNTQARNMAYALDLVEDQYPVICWEDDDLYLPGHVENIAQALETCELAGEKDSRYYNVASRRYRTLSSANRAALASTGVRGEALTALRTICGAAKNMIDVKLWQGFKGPKRVLDTNNVVGIKGLPGRHGIGVGHSLKFGTPDDGTVLREWVGEDRAAVYERFPEAA